jgi:hypothetical protein
MGIASFGNFNGHETLHVHFRSSETRSTTGSQARFRAGFSIGRSAG